MRIVGYIRVSDKEQIKKGFSLEAQEEHIHAWAAANGHEVVKVFVEPGRSGSKPFEQARPTFEHAVEYVKVGGADGLVVNWMDRFSRNVPDFLKVWVELAHAKRHLVSINEPMLTGNPDEPIQRFLAVAIMNANQLMAELSGAKATKGRDRRAKAGKYPGSVPIGYTRANRDVVVDEGYAPFVVTAFAEFSNGHHTLDTWTAEAAKRGYTTRKGQPIAKSQWGRILRNQFYTGVFAWKGETYHGDYPALVTVQAFDAVQEILDSRLTGDDLRRHFWLLSELVWSDVHHRVMTGALIKQKFRYYRAPGKPEHNVPAPELESRVIERLARIRYDGTPITLPESWRLGFSVAGNMRQVFDALKTDKEKRELLRRIFPRKGITVYRGGAIDVTLFDGFVEG